MSRFYCWLLLCHWRLSNQPLSCRIYILRNTNLYLYYFSTSRRCWRLKFFLVENKDLFILHDQIRSCWWLDDARSQGGVSRMFRELWKAFSQNFCITEIVLTMRISSWNFVRVLQYTYKVSAWNSRRKCGFWHCILFSGGYFGELAKRQNTPQDICSHHIDSVFMEYAGFSTVSVNTFSFFEICLKIAFVTGRLSGMEENEWSRIFLC